MPRINIGSFASGIASGYALGKDMDLKAQREAREQKQSDQLARIRELGINLEQGQVDDAQRVRENQAAYRNVVSAGAQGASTDGGATPSPDPIITKPTDGPTDTGLGATDGITQRPVSPAARPIYPGSFDALAAEATKRGDLDSAMKFTEAKRKMEVEGIKDVTIGALMGKDGSELEKIYNSRGDHKVDPGSIAIDQGTGVITGSMQGQPFRFDVKKSAELLGLVKPRPTQQTVVPPGGALAVDGKIVASNMDGLKARQSLDIQKLDYEYGLKRDLESFKAKHGDGKATAMVENINFLVKSGVASDAKEAFEKLKTSNEKPTEDAILGLATTLLRNNTFGGKDGTARALDKAREMVMSVKGVAPAGGAAQKPGTYSARGVTFTDADVDATAKKYGIPREQVLQRLGAQ